MKKRAFVRYSKQGKIVPGSLILTSGSFPSGPSTWNEVPADLCCNTVSTTCIEPLIMEILPDDQSGEFRFAISTQFSGSVKGTIDWGDGTPLESFDLPVSDESFLIHVYSGNLYVTRTVKVYFTDLSGFSNLELLSNYVIGRIFSLSNLPTVFKNAFTTEQVNINDQEIASLDVSGLSIDEFRAENCNNLTVVNVEGCSNLDTISLSSCNLERFYVNSFLNLRELNVASNSNLIILDIIGSIIIDDLDASGCALSEGTVDQILSELDNNGVNNGIVQLDGGTNAPPSVAGLASKLSLEGKGWNVNVN